MPYPVVTFPKLGLAGMYRDAKVRAEDRQLAAVSAQREKLKFQMDVNKTVNDTSMKMLENGMEWKDVSNWRASEFDRYGVQGDSPGFEMSYSGKDITISDTDLGLELTGRSKDINRFTGAIQSGQVDLSQPGALMNLATEMNVGYKTLEPEDKDLKKGIGPSGEDEYFYLDDNDEPTWVGVKTKDDDDTPKTAMAAFLKKNPNATPDEMAAFAQKLKGKGIEITLPDGTKMTVGGGGSDKTTKTKGTIENKITSGQEQINRMLAIKGEFKEHYQETGFRAAQAWTSIKAKLGRNVSPKDAKTLGEYKKFQRKAIENINLYIKELTGAQMSEKEADRLRLGQPDPGEKWWTGDDPITFQYKMDDVVKMARAAVARWAYYKNQDFSSDDIIKLIKSDNAISLEAIAARMK